MKERTRKLSPHGTPFQRRVWDLLTGIPARPTPTANSPRTSAVRKVPRAVGPANGRNPTGIVVPSATGSSA
ncbi:MGMT family protein [Streptomyces sp. KMM 9044]|nr:MGMT family protein [Streptomyces sp. KMM 9044]WAX81758.1 MGMT family protein [Streptomyces sp. KMM 9044]